MSSDEKSKKKPGFMKRLFSSKKLSVDDDIKENKNSKKLQRNNTVDPGSLSREDTSVEPKADGTKPKRSESQSNGATKPKGDGSARPKSNSGGASKPRTEGKKPKPKRESATKARRKKKSKDKEVKVDLTKGLSFPCTPEVLLEHHKTKPFLSSSEEWLIVELNEFECVLENMSIVKIIAKHSKFFEVEPDELWEEFFEWVDDIPAYDEIINYDIWQEFRDKKYPM